MNPTNKPRFTLSPEEEPDPGFRIKKRRFTLFGEEDTPGAGRKIFGLAPSPSRKKLFSIAIVAGAALAGIAVILIVTGVFFKRPQIFTPGGPPSGEGSIFSGADRAELPGGAGENIHLARGRQSYQRGYFNDALAEFAEVVESDASDSDKAMALTYTGIIHDEQGDYNKAVDSYNRALRYDRKNPVIYRNLALAYRHKKDYDKAGEYAEKAVDMDSGNVSNRVLLGNLYFEQGKYAKAADEYSQALKVEPENAAALYNLGVSLYRKGDEVAAIEYLKRAGASDKMGEIAKLAYAKLGVIFTERRDLDMAEKYLGLGVSIAPSDPVNHYNLGIVYLKQNKADQALQEFTKAEALGKEDSSLLEGLGEAYFSMKEYNRSIDTYGRLLETNRRNVKVLSRIAEIHYEKGDLDKAYEYYHKITTLEPASENARVAYLNMGNILDDAQRFNESIDAYQKALAISPKDDAALYNLGIAYKHAGKPELAVDSWKKASALNPDTPQPLLALADFYYERNYYDLAMDEYQRILRRWPNIQEGHFNLATIYYKKNLNEYAIEEYKRVIEINDKNDFARKAYINLGILTSKSGKGGEETMQNAAGYVQKALMLKPGDADSLFSLGILYSKKEMYDKAIDTFYQAMRATRDSKLIAEAHNNIGKCHFKKGQYKKALQSFTRGIEEDPTNEELRMNRKTAMQAYEEELARK